MIHQSSPTTAPARSTRTGQVSPPSRSPWLAPADVAIPELRHGLVPVADGVRLHYVTCGSGEPVLLIPGWPQSWYAWRFVIPMLAEAGRRVIAVDPRGFGDSDKPDTGYDVGTAALDIHRLIDGLDLNEGKGIDIVSHDVGTWIAHAHAVEHPTDVRRLVVTDALIPGVSPEPPAGYPGPPAQCSHLAFRLQSHRGSSRSLGARPRARIPAVVLRSLQMHPNLEHRTGCIRGVPSRVLGSWCRAGRHELLPGSV